ncbi:MAG: 50S ribosomal protein L25 [Candidatus Spechtbacterales bacterium]|nr:50S ribosomal protein L25 [Candidatus Spechtbacterales bacterium]
MLHLKVKKRDPKKEKAKKLIQKDLVPAIMYGPRIKPTPLTVDRRSFYKTYKEAGETTLIALDMKEKAEAVEGAKDEENKAEEENVVLIRDLQVHPVSGDFMHVDFYQLPMDTEIEISVPVEGLNEAPAVKEEGGVLVQNLHEIAIKALPKDLIHDITVDLLPLENIGDSILIKDLDLPGSVEVLAEEDEAVFAIEEPREEEPEEEEEILDEMEDEQIADIKTEGEVEREEREAEEAEEGGEKSAEGGGEEK